MSTLEHRFWSKVDKGAPDQCWEWRGATTRGYGSAWDGRKVVSAHRLSLKMAGVAIDGRFVCHKCDNRRCVNPRHLYAGTRSDNARDSIRAGTFQFHPAPRGEDNYNAVLTADQVAEIRRCYVPRDRKRGGRALARQYGVSSSAVFKILRGETWGHVNAIRA